MKKIFLFLFMSSILFANNKIFNDFHSGNLGTYSSRSIEHATEIISFFKHLPYLSFFYTYIGMIILFKVNDFFKKKKEEKIKKIKEIY